MHKLTSGMDFIKDAQMGSEQSKIASEEKKWNN